MKFPIGLLLVFLIALTGCDSAKDANTRSVAEGPPQGVASQGALPDGDVAANATAGITHSVEAQKVSLNDAGTLAAAAEAADRKIIRNAALTMEVNSTTEAQHRVTSIAESHGGFVVTSEAKQREDAEPAKRTLDIKLVIRVPASHFGPVLDEIRALTKNLREENVTGQDVTEEFIDLEARIKTKRALELQFLDIMKQASKVADALEVQRQLAEVRTEIEQLEGRKRFIENRASLSTITVNLEAPRQIAVTSTGFGRSLRETVSDSLDLGTGIILFLIRFVIVMIPITLFVLLPLGLVLRYLVRRAKRIRLAEALATPPAE
ncbi:MAG TPA: DUF4349 domain-containing protein [Pyrinomonadaceae bacterium]|nr:DUF4349 domain-containing protein [Pyrinomonadaceae bacterium]